MLVAGWCLHISHIPKAGVTVTTTSPSARLKALGSNSTAIRLQSARRGVQVRQEVAARLCLLGSWAALAGLISLALGHLLLVLLIHFHHRLSSEVERECGSDQWKKSDLNHCVVEHGCFGLASRSITVLELATDSAVASGNGHTSGKYTASLHDNGRSDPCKCSVHERGRATTTELVRLRVDVRVAGKHADVWDFDVVEEQEAIVHGVVTEFGANVTNVDVLEWLVGLQIADLDAEGSRAVGLALDDQLRHDDCVVGSAAQRTNPPFARREMGRVDGEGLVVLIPGGGCLETTDVGAVAQLCLRIAADDLVVVGFGEPHFLLLGGTLLAECDLNRERRVSVWGMTRTLNMLSWRP
jgi:hypothetical protein